jgi:hypothetical protein
MSNRRRYHEKLRANITIVSLIIDELLHCRGPDKKDEMAIEEALKMLNTVE